MYKLQTGGRYIAKGGDQVALGDILYKAEDVDGWYSPAHRIQVTNTETGEVRMYFPGEAIEATVEVKEDKLKTKKKKKKKDE